MWQRPDCQLSPITRSAPGLGWRRQRRRLGNCLLESHSLHFCVADPSPVPLGKGPWVQSVLKLLVSTFSFQQGGVGGGRVLLHRPALLSADPGLPLPWAILGFPVSSFPSLERTTVHEISKFTYNSETPGKETHFLREGVEQGSSGKTSRRRCHRV